MNLKNIFLITLLSFIWGCKNEIDINAPYKDIPVVYGFLDQNEPINYLRIQKLYQNSGTLSTLEGAQNPDSLYYDSLYITITDSVTKKVYTCYQVDTVSKESGFFANSKHTLYAVTLPKNNGINELYRLDIYYPAKMKHYSAVTGIVKDATIGFRKIYLNLGFPNHVFQFRFTSGRNSAIYDLGIRYEYLEMDANDTSKQVVKKVYYQVSKSIPYAPEKDIQININSLDYVNFLKTQIPYDQSKLRRTLGIYYQAYGGTDRFREMLDLTKPNLTVVEKNPEFSNISNGLGIFTSRNYREMQMGIDPSTVTLFAELLPNFEK
jgi:hypothetical protein